ncbi:hypothetical protein RDI58_027057 [Solanum bulbocastanum]|uniref:Reverse transcriptase zinc-binding domain-containing protein n=1 Tax=Solanum bulbocastanum TaxID=147425 RepID=A0AAN8T040_SOLBU
MGQITDERDQHWWMPNSKEKVTMKSDWDLMRHRKEIQQDIMFIWEKGIPFRASFLLWRTWFQRIPIGDILMQSIYGKHFQELLEFKDLSFR